uniref:Uncharacterized protein n=1 Tax=Lactuca sativa TaxID=4236 RepID=A0A9R1XCY5_LACSA|nr:hypothetical protein LSAT_V11C500263100 [Lactuca sativa]
MPRTLTVSALGADTFEGTTLAVIGGGSVAAIAAVISLAEPEKRRQLQAKEVVGQVHISGLTISMFRLNFVLINFRLNLGDTVIC